MEHDATRSAKATLDEAGVRRAYRRWAPVYDATFGAVAAAARRAAVAAVNALPPGRVLEVGVGTGLSLPHYLAGHRITGIDLSPDMLDRARARVSAGKLSHVEALVEMDAGAMRLPDAHFDVAVAMFVMTVVPDPRAVMSELARVVRPGGTVLLVNHFSREGDGLRARIERAMAPHALRLGWHPVFEEARVTGTPRLVRISRRELPPAGLFTLLRFDRAG